MESSKEILMPVTALQEMAHAAGQEAKQDAEKCQACAAHAGEKPWFRHAFQPIFDVRQGAVLGYEALVRGLNGEGALHVLAQVDESNRYLFDQLCRTEAVRRAGQLAMREQLFINFLPNAVYKPESCIRRTLSACKQFGFPLQQIVFEVSESECVDNRHHLLDILKAYTDIGFKTAIDDFGAGYAGLTLLRNYQPDYLKIDMELIRGVDANPVAQSIVRAVLDMAHEIGTQVIAEGVETAAERDWLAEAGVDYQQGYLLARPAYLLQTRAQG